MEVVTEILEALEARREDLSNLDITLDTLTKMEENLTTMIIVQAIELEHLKKYKKYGK